MTNKFSTKSEEDLLVALAIEFHVATNVDIGLIQKFMRDVSEVTSHFAVKVMKEVIDDTYKRTDKGNFV